ncbi:hypothetical protein K7432_008494 [Basidiobolus ranarum]|uniref:Uncharacterized protein n=1 Tax=Basidiobolus ranarum TaxID=34480 RepID=A0ABR2VYG8_9FUNG
MPPANTKKKSQIKTPSKVKHHPYASPAKLTGSSKGLQTPTRGASSLSVSNTPSKTKSGKKTKNKERDSSLREELNGLIGEVYSFGTENKKATKEEIALKREKEVKEYESLEKDFDSALEHFAVMGT